MTETIVFPNLVAAVLPYLRTRLTARGRTVPVVNRVPTTRPSAFVRVSPAGGERLSLTKRETRLLVECYDVDDEKAQSLAELTSAELEAATRSQAPMAPGVWVSADQDAFSVPVDFPDPLSSSPRYQFYCNLVLTGSTI